MDCLPVLGQLTLRLMRSARFFGRVFPSYKSAMLCFSIGPSFKITVTAMSCVPPHLLQRATILYRATELFVVSGIASSMPSFSCMAARIVCCFGDSVKDKKRGDPSYSTNAVHDADRFHGRYPPNINEGTHLISGRGPTRISGGPLRFN
jgi:hypothetical protein